MYSQIRFFASWLMAGLLSGLIGCASIGITPATRVISAEPAFTGKVVPQRVVMYNFIDWELSYTTDRFRAMVQKRLQDALLEFGVKSEHVWYCDTPESDALRSNKKNHTLSNSVFVEVGTAIRNNIVHEYNIKATHRIIVFPIEAGISRGQAIINVKWDIVSTQTGYHDWTAYTHTIGLRKDMSIEESDRAAQSFVDAIAAAMRDKKVFSASSP